MVSGTEQRNDRWLPIVLALLVVAGAVAAILWGSFAKPEVATDARIDPQPAPESRLDPPNPEPIPAVAGSSVDAWAAWARGDYGTAAALYAAELEAEPTSASAAYMLGLAAWKSGDLDTAVEAMTRAAELDLGSLRAQVNLSRIHNARHDGAAALAAADAALLLDPHDPTALYQRARSLRNLGRVDEAVTVLTECLARQPAYGHALNLLGLIHLERGEVEPALDALASAATLEPSVAFVQRNLGAALALGGRAEEAEVAYRRASDLEAGRVTESVTTPEPVALAAATPAPVSD